MKNRLIKPFILALSAICLLANGQTHAMNDNKKDKIDEKSFMQNYQIIRSNSDNKEIKKLNTKIFFPNELHNKVLLNTIPGVGNSYYDTVGNSYYDTMSLGLTCHYWYDLMNEATNKASKVVIIGSTGCGKSTLVYLLTGKQLVAELKPSCLVYQLTATEEISNIKIEHRLITGTPQIATIVDPWHPNQFIIDCPGFGDPRGSQQDYKNSVNLYKLLKNHPIKKTQIILVAPESSMRDGCGSFSFISLINKITEMFPDQTQLETMVSLVITKQELKTIELLKDTASNGLHLAPRGRNFLQFLVNHADRVVDCCYPSQEGLYHVSGNFRNLITNDNYVMSPQVTYPQENSIKHHRWSSKYGYNVNGIETWGY